jgi:hypothetical protein
MSKFSDILELLGFIGCALYSEESPYKVIEHFSATEQHEALIENFYLADYFTEKNLWNTVHALGSFSDETKTFNSLNQVFIEAGANQNNPNKFDAKYVIDSLFKEKEFDEKDALDFVTYTAQTAFERESWQERDAIAAKLWMEKHKEKYLENARKLNLVDAVPPIREKYDETWFMGAAAGRIETRLQYFKDTSANIDGGILRILTGEREVSANLDEKDYVLYLAQKHGIKYDQKNPFKLINGQQYLNYLQGEFRKLTETDILKDKYKKIFGSELPANWIIDTKQQNNERPTTYTTALDAAELMLKQHKDKELHIRIISNQPYIDRQVVIVQAAINEKINEANRSDLSVKVHGTGAAFSSQIKDIHSELGALIGEQYKVIIQKIGAKRDSKSLMFQSRPKLDALKIPSFEEYKTNSQISTEKQPLKAG